MKSWKIILVVTAALMLAGQAAAQTEEREATAAEAAELHEMQEREAEMQRRMHDAERRMAEAARQMAELTHERLPQLEGIQRRFEFITDDRPRLGVTISGDEKGPVKGVSILGVSPGSAADDAGLRAGDLITAVNGESLGAEKSDIATERLLDFMRGVEEGDTLELDYVRDGKAGTLEVEPKPVESEFFAFSGDGRNFTMPRAPGAMVRPGLPEGPNTLVFEWTSDGWGDMELVELNEGLGKYFGTDEGLLVVNAPDSSSLQLEDGDVIQKIDGRAPTSVRHALRILSSYQAGESLKLEIMRDKKRRTLEVEIADDLTGHVAPRLAPVVRPARVPSPPRPSTPVERT